MAHSWYISLPSSSKQQHEMATVRCLVNVNHDGSFFLHVYSQFNSVFIQFRDSFDKEKQT